MSNLTEYGKLEYQCFDTSPEILSVIEQMTIDSILDKTSKAFQLWSCPQGKQEEIIHEAFKLLDEREDTLYWGICEFTRPELA